MKAFRTGGDPSAAAGGDGVTAVASKQLRHVLSVTSGATPDSGKPEYWDGDIRWVTPEDVSALHGYWLSETRRRITREGYDSCGT